jgi:hypothetical protein
MNRPKKNDKHIWRTYYTPKKIIELIEGEELTTETGRFLKDAADKLEKGLTQNPPFEVKDKEEK